MSCSLDVNILVYASNTGSDHNGPARTLMDQLVGSGELVYLPWSTVLGYLRIATNPRIFRHPLSQEVAQQNVTSLLLLPNVRVLAEAEDFWEHYLAAAKGQRVHGAVVPDTALAALLRQHGIKVLYTADAGFRRFPFLKVINPFEQ